MISEYSPLTLISKYRNAVMGLAIIGVMLGHWFAISNTPADNLFLKIVSIIPALVSTQGFLFISGYGIYYSFSKNNAIMPFYQRRFNRMILPFMLMGLPYFLFRLCFEGISIWQFFGYLTTLAYWTEGNYCGMWYVAVSTVLYIICPFIYKLFFYRNSFIHTTTCMITLLIIAVFTNHILFTYSNANYELYFNGLERYYMFFIGMYCGYLSRTINIHKNIGLGFIVMMLPIAYVLTWYSSEYEYLTAAARRLVITMPLASICFALIDKAKYGQPIMDIANWLGKYTFELYILHLLIYCLLSSEVFGFGLSDRTYISIAIILALLFCLPVQKSIKFITRQ